MGENESFDIKQRKQKLAGIFDGAASTYGHVGPRFFSHFGRRLIEVAQIPSDANVLDVATGRGALLFPAIESIGPQGSIIGIDLSEKMVHETNKELVNMGTGKNVKLRQMDAEHLQFPDDSFDHVLCGFAIFFFPQLDKAMAEFRRVLKPKGYICVSTFDKTFEEEWDWFYEIVERYLPSNPDEKEKSEVDPEYKPVFNTPDGLKEIMTRAGFDMPQVFSETADFIYATEDAFWATLWSIGSRGTLEEIEQKTGAEGLQKFKLDVFKKFDELKQDDGLHQQIPVHITLATKPEV